MNQRKYALDLISESGLAITNSVPTPIIHNLKLITRDYDEKYLVNLDDKLVNDIEQYRHIIERLLYLTMTRSNIAYFVQTLSQYVHDPKKLHLDAALRVVQYIKSDLGQGLFFMSSNTLTVLSVYCDSD